VLVRSGPVVGQVTVGDAYATYRRRPAVIVHRRPVARPVVVVERYAPRVVVVERLHGHRSSRAWSRRGYRPDTLLPGRPVLRPLERALAARRRGSGVRARRSVLHLGLRAPQSRSRG
jgi:hypothetical protein